MNNWERKREKMMIHVPLKPNNDVNFFPHEQSRLWTICFFIFCFHNFFSGRIFNINILLTCFETTLVFIFILETECIIFHMKSLESIDECIQKHKRFLIKTFLKQTPFYRCKFIYCLPCKWAEMWTKKNNNIEQYQLNI